MTFKVIGIKCLSGGCPKRYKDIEIKKFVGDNIYYKYRKFYNREIKLRNPNNVYVYCPAVNCDEMVDITFLDSRINMVDCNDGHHFCIRCRKSHEHEKDECKEVVLF